MKVVTISLDQIWEDKKANISLIEGLMLDACQNKPDIVVFPEMTLTGFTMNASAFAEDYETSTTIAFFQQLSFKYNVNLVFGMILNTLQMPTNNQIVINRLGEVVSRYEKIHPFSYSGEDCNYSKGSKIAQFNIEGVNCASTICYDLRFPELYQILSKDSYVIFNIANWPERRVADWNLLLRARALENQCYVVGVNRTGIDGKNLAYAKSSVVISPQGTDVEVNHLTDIIDEFNIDIDALEFYRTTFPVKNDRRIELYKTLMSC